MSTILDALRKLEEERQSRSADARSRLLLSSAHQPQSRRWRRPSWRAHTTLIGIISFALAGFAAGAGVVLWQSYSSPVQPEQVSTFAPPKGHHNEPTATLANTPTPSTVIEEKTLAHTISPASQPMDLPPVVAPAAPLAQASPSPDRVADDGLQSAPVVMTADESAPDTASAVQRSPFISPSPAREAMPRSSVTSPSSAPATQSKEAFAVHAMPRNKPRMAESPQPTKEATTPAPAGTSLSLLQWSSDPARRIAFLRVNGGPLTMAHEGDTIGGYTVIEIRQNAVELQSGETKMTLRTP